MPGREFLAGFRLATLGRGLRRARIRRAGHMDSARDTPTAVSPGSSAADEDHEGSAERVRPLKTIDWHLKTVVFVIRQATSPAGRDMCPEPSLWLMASAW